MGPRRAPLASIVADFGSLDAMCVDYHVSRCTVTECAALACGFRATFGASSAVNRTSWGRFSGWLDCEGLPTVRRSVQVVYHTIAGCLADALKVLSPGLPPLVRVSRMGLAQQQDAAPDVAWHHGRVTSSTEPNASTLKQVPIATNWSIIAPLVAAPDAQRRLIPANVAGTIVVTGVRTIAADATALAILESLIGLYILSQDPSLQHRSCLAIG